MAYIGKEPVVGNFQVCDAISVVNGQAAYTMQVSSTNVVPESANHMLVSLNGILQKPGSSFTVSGSTITFASNLATGDVIDFIMLLGNVLDIGTPSDATVTNAKTNFTSTSSAAGLQIKGDGTTDGTLQLNCSQNSHGIKLASPAHSAGQSYTLKFPTGNVTADKFLKVASVSGSGTTGIGQLSFADAGGANTPAFFATSIISEDNTAISNDTFTKLTMDTEVFDTDNTYSSDRFTPGVAGKYLITAKASATNVVNSATVALAIYKNGSIMEAVHYSNYGTYTSYFNDLGNANAGYYTMALNVLVDANSTDYFELYGRHNIGGNTGGLVDKYFGAFKLIGA